MSTRKPAFGKKIRGPTKSFVSSTFPANKRYNAVIRTRSSSHRNETICDIKIIDKTVQKTGHCALVSIAAPGSTLALPRLPAHERRSLEQLQTKKGARAGHRHPGTRHNGAGKFRKKIDVICPLGNLEGAIYDKQKDRGTKTQGKGALITSERQGLPRARESASKLGNC